MSDARRDEALQDAARALFLGSSPAYWIVHRDRI
jgi:hypothetical protein